MSHSTPAVTQHTSCHIAHQLSHSTPAVTQHTSCHTAHQLSHRTPAVAQHTSCHLAHQLSHNTSHIIPAFFWGIWSPFSPSSSAYLISQKSLETLVFSFEEGFMHSKIFLNTQPSFYLEILTISLQNFLSILLMGVFFTKILATFFFHGTYRVAHEMSYH